MKGFRECPHHKEPLREAVWKRLIICRGTNWSQMVWIIQYKQAWRETIFPKKHRKANCMFPVLSCSTFCAALLHGTCCIPLGFSLPSELLQSAQQLGFHFKFSKLHSKHVNICIFLYTYAGCNSSRHCEQVLAVTSSTAPQRWQGSWAPSQKHRKSQECWALLRPNFCTNPRASSFLSLRPKCPVPMCCGADSKQPVPLSGIPKEKAQCSQATHK